MSSIISDITVISPSIICCWFSSILNNNGVVRIKLFGLFVFTCGAFSTELVLIVLTSEKGVIVLKVS